jgi:hypothetical protein
VRAALSEKSPQLKLCDDVKTLSRNLVESCTGKDGIIHYLQPTDVAAFKILAEPAFEELSNNISSTGTNP